MDLSRTEETGGSFASTTAKEALLRSLQSWIPSEIQELTWNDVDAEANKILIHSPKTRHIGKHARLVPIFDHVQKPLNDLFHKVNDDEIYVFPTIRKLSNIAKIAADHVEKARVEQWPIFLALGGI